MILNISSAEFVCSNTDYKKCPQNSYPEYAFIGRSNVGKSSLINMITNSKGLAKTSASPGKTQLINHFIMNKETKTPWYLVDLPGYGYAKVSKSKVAKWQQFIQDYLTKRKTLINIFLLIDCRHEPQKIDLDFMDWLGENGLPFTIIFTKSDKLSKTRLDQSIERYMLRLIQTWEDLPPYFVTSAEDRVGKELILHSITLTNQLVYGVS
jgi:GTP-binding protein